MQSSSGQKLIRLNNVWLKQKFFLKMAFTILLLTGCIIHYSKDVEPLLDEVARAIAEIKEWIEKELKKF